MFVLKTKYKMVESDVNQRNMQIKMLFYRITSPLSKSALETKDQSMWTTERKMFTGNTQHIQPCIGLFIYRQSVGTHISTRSSMTG